VLDLLRSFASRAGHTRVPAQHREGNFQLGWMVTYLRARRRAGNLSHERIHKLERLPGWSWDPIQDQFDRGLRLLRQFALREGHCCIPSSHHERGFDLAHWVERQRGLFRHRRMPRDRARALRAVPGWSWRGASRDHRFLRALTLLRRFATRAGHTRVPSMHAAPGVNLNRWVVEQRAAYHAGRLQRARIRALESVPGWTWRPREDRFEEDLHILRRYVAREGHSRVPRRHMEGAFPLGVWVMQLRQSCRLGKLSRAHARVVERLAGWTWNARRSRQPAPSLRRG
jgi:hypothetical protein